MSDIQTGVRNTEVDSKIAHAYDEAIARAQVDPNNLEPEQAELRGQPDVTTSKQHELRAEGADSVASIATEEDSFGPSDDLRDREFPIPPATANSGSGKLLVDQDTMNDDESRRGGPIGTKQGDIQPRTEVPSVLDQDALMPDLASEQR
jgi:hypothetical protein